MAGIHDGDDRVARHDLRFRRGAGGETHQTGERGRERSTRRQGHAWSAEDLPGERADALDAARGASIDAPGCRAPGSGDEGFSMTSSTDRPDGERRTLGDPKDPSFERLLTYLKESRSFDFTGYKRVQPRCAGSTGGWHRWASAPIADYSTTSSCTPRSSRRCSTRS
jgi:hypothetical protein